MSSIRFFRRISFAVATVVGVAFPVLARADDAIRLSWEDFAKDPQKVASLRKAVAVMKSRNSAGHTSTEYRKSWEYWANIHGYYGPESPFGTVAFTKSRVPARYRHYFDGVVDQTPPDQVARDTWAQCQHGTPWFFAWHRLYLFYFEQQLQEAAGDATLRLPYWDYTSPNELEMPTAFIEPTYKNANGAVEPNPLFEKRRAPDWEQGGGSLDATSTDVDSALGDQDFSTYQSDIEGNVHGYVHCAVSVTCPVTDMGAVPYSSNDPIFWLHHANIDRLWSCWTNTAGHQNPIGDKNFSFVDANGQEVTKNVADLFNSSLIDYKYEQETNCARAPLVALNNAPVEESAARVPEAMSDKFNELVAQPRVMNVPTKPVSLTAATTKVKVQLRNDSDSKTLSSLAFNTIASKPTRTRLILGGITFEAPPGVQFYVYLEDSADPNRREYAGTINFFGAEPGAMEHHHGGSADLAGTGLTREFDVTQAMRKLSANNVAMSDVTVEFVATTGRRSSAETAEINSEARLTVKSIDFQVSAVK